MLRFSPQSEAEDQQIRWEGVREPHLVRVSLQRVSHRCSAGHRCKIKRNFYFSQCFCYSVVNFFYYLLRTVFYAFPLSFLVLSRNEDEEDRAEKVEKGTKVRRKFSSLRNRMTGSFNKDKVNLVSCIFHNLLLFLSLP